MLKKSSKQSSMEVLCLMLIEMSRKGS